ncbi:bifunctional DNA-formamidopyrimidine glycosylase/DNA-(apurinic or apyrimidinic site) lyase [Rhizosaccharibacter radicis]|uniref:Formamidopyrimidine-DNA glycosylase n=1 Tax=Rhizosaccharibacter radicis TaxID=2782605 RepID=A0ABT1VWS0_9PROT|nr:bifunctional DNA-formamidopyrimidine glycosylase/DNA-(apurinic or apyrimidinic site) lyase [Acetobacteraceae bacterium KSS12]
MPELPEVETVMRGMRAHLEGHTIVRAEMRRPDLRWAMPPNLAERLRGARVTGFRRRGKYILMRLDGDDSVLIHLGMSGRVRLSRLDPAIPVEVLPHEHVALETEEGCRFGLIDPRRFGAVDLMPTAAEDGHRLIAALGTEPLEDGFDGPALHAMLAGKRTPLKAALLDQRLIAGLGNIYVCEALFRARLSPFREARTLGTAEAAALAAAIRAVLTEAIAAGGSSLRDYVQPDGELGYFQHRWKVYGREGERCELCAVPPGCPGIRRETQGGRSTFFCDRVQH